MTFGASLSDTGNAFIWLSRPENQSCGIPLNVPPYDELDDLLTPGKDSCRPEARPGISGIAGFAGFLSLGYNSGLAGVVQGLNLGLPGIDVRVLDAYAMLNAVVADSRDLRLPERDRGLRHAE